MPLPAFDWQDYLALNKDLHSLKTKEEALEHYEARGRDEGRLVSRKQLRVSNEFGFELVLYAGYYAYLCERGLLFDNVIETYRGMRELYYFLPYKQVQERDVPRDFVGKDERPFLCDEMDRLRDMPDTRFWRPLRLREAFANDRAWNKHVCPVLARGCGKPLAIVHNKYCIEWGDRPYNFMPTPTVLSVIDALVAAGFQVVYIRPRPALRLITDRGFVHDHNSLLDMDDFQAITNKFGSRIGADVVLFEDILQRVPHRYNHVKAMLYAHCSHFVHVQGGNAVFGAFFGGHHVIYHAHGPELSCGSYDGWYRRLCPDRDIDLTVVQTLGELPAAVSAMAALPPVAPREIIRKSDMFELI